MQYLSNPQAVKKVVFLSFVIAISYSFMEYVPYTDVFICKGKYSKKYHYNSSCRGLSNCSTKAYKVSLEEAKNLERTLCGWED